ncbi:hypothetical protein CDEN61S_03820 [Castellaniella denitrificans]
MRRPRPYSFAINWLVVIPSSCASCDSVSQNRFSSLMLVLAVLVEIDHGAGLAPAVVLDARRLTPDPQVEPAGGFRPGDFGIQGRPLGRRLAALETEALLDTGAWPSAAGPGPGSCRAPGLRAPRSWRAPAPPAACRRTGCRPGRRFPSGTRGAIRAGRGGWRTPAVDRWFLSCLSPEMMSPGEGVPAGSHRLDRAGVAAEIDQGEGGRSSRWVSWNPNASR